MKPFFRRNTLCIARKNGTQQAEKTRCLGVLTVFRQAQKSNEKYRFQMPFKGSALYQPFGANPQNIRTIIITGQIPQLVNAVAKLRFLRTYSPLPPCALDSSDARQRIGSMGVSPLRFRPALSRSIIVLSPPSSPCRLLSGSVVPCLSLA